MKGILLENKQHVDVTSIFSFRIACIKCQMHYQKKERKKKPTERQNPVSYKVRTCDYKTSGALSAQEKASTRTAETLSTVCNHSRMQ